MSANCTQSGWKWSYNSYGQNPCDMASLLEASCRNLTAYIIPPLISGQNYVVPDPTDPPSMTCECNTVVYSLYAACMACQNAPILKLSFWDASCMNAIVASQYTGQIPQGTAVPFWAYLDVATGDTFNATLAQAAASNTPNTTSSVHSSPLASSGPGSSPNSPSALSSLESSHSSTNVGGIVGGVIGGAAALAIIAGLILWCLKRKPRSKGGRDDTEQGLFSGEELSYYFAPTMPFYSPDDPWTFPPTTTNNNPTTAARAHDPFIPSDERGTYSGAPEL